MAVKATDIINAAKKEVGTKATPIRNCKYNTWYYGHAVSGDCYHWCAVFVCWVFNQLGQLTALLYGKNASCGYMAKAFQNHGKLIVPKKASDVKVGDVVFFHWSNERSTLVPGTYVSDHVGIVTGVNGNGTINTIEGNTVDSVNGQVAARTRSMDVVSCLGRPTYAAGSAAAAATNTAKTAKPTVLYRVRSGGVWRKEVNDLSSYAGTDVPITDIAIKVTGGGIKYRVHIKGGGWLPYVTGYNIADSKNGYAGNGNPIDAVEVYYNTPEAVRKDHGYLRAKYRVYNGSKWYDWQYDNEKSGGQDGYAGVIGKNLYRVQIALAE